VIRYLAKAHLGVWSFAALAMLAVVNIVQRGGTWDGDIYLAASGLGIPYFVFGPMFAAVVAVDAARLSSAGRQHLVRLPSPWRNPYVVALGTSWLPVAAVQLLIGFVTFAVVAPSGLTGGTVGMALLVMVVLAFVSLAAGAVGSYIGRHLRPLVAALLAGASVFALNYVNLVGGSGFYALDFGAGTVSRIGTQYSIGYLLTQIGVLAVVSALLLFSPVRLRGQRVVPSISGVALGLAALMLVVSPPDGLPQHRYVDAGHPATECGGAPAICTYNESASSRAPYVQMITDLVTAAQDKGYSAFVPDRVEQVVPTYHPAGSGERVFTFMVEPDGPHEDDLVMGMLTPVHCPQLSADTAPSEEFWTDLQNLAGTWLALAGHDGSAATQQWGISGFHPLTPEEAEQTVERLDACDFQ
jgi:hypothetical protein